VIKEFIKERGVPESCLRFDRGSVWLGERGKLYHETPLYVISTWCRLRLIEAVSSHIRTVHKRVKGSECHRKATGHTGGRRSAHMTRSLGMNVRVCGGSYPAGVHQDRIRSTYASLLSNSRPTATEQDSK
jgi:hypothetical protein